jgi:hypothetical protein
MMTSSSDDDDDDPDNGGQCARYTSATALGEAYCRFQGLYLFNLQKLLNEALSMGVSKVIRWHPKIKNALEIHWTRFSSRFETVHPVLVRYKLCRGENRIECVRPTMNRKLREWNFTMTSAGTGWVTYTYHSDAFHADVGFGALPTHRRGRQE